MSDCRGGDALFEELSIANGEEGRGDEIGAVETGGVDGGDGGRRGGGSVGDGRGGIGGGGARRGVDDGPRCHLLVSKREVVGAWWQYNISLYEIGSSLFVVLYNIALDFVSISSHIQIHPWCVVWDFVWWISWWRFPAKNEAKIQMDFGAKQRSNWKVFDFLAGKKIRMEGFLILAGSKDPTGRFSIFGAKHRHIFALSRRRPRPAAELSNQQSKSKSKS